MVSEMIGITVFMAFVRSQNLSSSSILLEAASVIFFEVFAVYLIPRFHNHVQFLRKKTFIEFETKFMLFVLLVVSLVSEELGVHAATGSFLAGLFLSESTHKGLQIEDRLRPIIELLVPVFFVHIGYLVEPSLISASSISFAVVLAATVYVARIALFYSFDELTSFGFDYEKVTLFAPCMTITATAAEIGLNASLFSPQTFTTFIITGLLLTVIGPLGLRGYQAVRS
jgi:Kef-type K+ transport system membrane component KefB